MAKNGKHDELLRAAEAAAGEANGEANPESQPLHVGAATEPIPDVAAATTNGAKEHPHALDDCAQVLLDWLGTIDPAWADRIKALQAERGLDAKQSIGSMCGYVLDLSLHMLVPSHSAFETGDLAASGKAKCAQCSRMFERAYPGQPLCGNACAGIYFSPEKKAAREAAQAAQLAGV